ncbi:MAG: GNAT family N-acetyltransferase [Pleurocapsa sp. SU_196_0]|nr:GNAT family N-acetyltransferase [Pleurocapsa sp. SU_196_0]
MFVADSQYHLTQGSRWVRAAFRVPKPRLCPTGFARALEEIVSRERVDLVIPTCEEIFWLMLVLDDSEFSALRTKVFAPNLEVLHGLHHKKRFHDLLRTLGIRTPETTLLESSGALERLNRTGSLVLKPAYSRFGARMRLLSPRDKIVDVPRITRSQPWLAQEFIHGEELCAFAVAWGGRVNAFALYRPGWRAGRGAATSFSLLPRDDPRNVEALEVVTRLTSSLNFTGQIALDVMSDAHGLSVLECNPRATSGVHLFAPEDHLENAYLHDLGTPIIATGVPARLGVPMLLCAFPKILEPHGVETWTRTWRDSRDVLRDPRDPLSVRHQLRCVLESLREAWRLRCSVLEATTADIEWNGEGLETSRVPPRVAVGMVSKSDSSSREEWGERFLAEFVNHDVSKLIENISSQFTALRVNDHLLPVTVSRGEPDAAYVVSPFTHFVSYALDELRELNSPVLERAVRVALEGLGALLHFGTVDDVVFVNNAPVSTNLHPDLTLPELRTVTEHLTRAFPSCAIGFRSVHGRDSRLPEFLRELGYRLVPSRSVTFVPTRDAAFKGKRDVRQDARLLRHSGYVTRRLESPSQAELERIAELYRLLYLEKYSRHNPRFTPAFMEMASRTGMLEFLVLERDGRLDGVIGLYVRAGYLTVPVLGYDTHLPRELGLYRMLSSLIAHEAHRRGVDLHASSGRRGVQAFTRWRSGTRVHRGAHRAPAVSSALRVGGAGMGRPPCRRATDSRAGTVKVVVTGATGFLGAHTVTTLQTRGVDVLALGRDPGKLARFGTRGSRVDLADLEGLTRAFQGADAVVHAAALSQPWGRLEDFRRVNVDGTRNVLSAAASVGVKRLVHISSPAVIFDDADQFEVPDSAPYPSRYSSCYALTKKRAEQLVLEANLECVVLRPKAIYGPGDTSLLPRLVKALERVGCRRSGTDATAWS